MKKESFALLVLVTLAVVLPAPMVFADACTGPHGTYSSILCSGDRMAGDGAYIQSPSGQYRFYIGAGNAFVQDMWNLNVLYALYSGGNAWAAQVGPLTGCIGSTDPNAFALLDYYGTRLTLYCVSTTTYLKLDDDGCLRYYSQLTDIAYDIEEHAYAYGCRF